MQVLCPTGLLFLSNKVIQINNNDKLKQICLGGTGIGILCGNPWCYSSLPHVHV